MHPHHRQLRAAGIQLLPFPVGKETVILSRGGKNTLVDPQHENRPGRLQPDAVAFRQDHLIHGIGDAAEIDTGKRQPEQVGHFPGGQRFPAIEIAKQIQHIHNAVPLAVDGLLLLPFFSLGQVLQRAGMGDIPVYRRGKPLAGAAGNALPQFLQRLCDGAAGRFDRCQFGGVVLRCRFRHPFGIIGKGPQPVVACNLPDIAVILQPAGILRGKAGGRRAGKPQQLGGTDGAAGSLQSRKQKGGQRGKQDTLLFAVIIRDPVFRQHHAGIFVPVHAAAEDYTVLIAQALLPHQPADLRRGKPHFLVNRIGLDQAQHSVPGGRNRPGGSKGPLQPGQRRAAVAAVRPQEHRRADADPALLRLHTQTQKELLLVQKDILFGIQPVAGHGKGQLRRRLQHQQKHLPFTDAEVIKAIHPDILIRKPVFLPGAPGRHGQRIQRIVEPLLHQRLERPVDELHILQLFGKLPAGGLLRQLQQTLRRDAGTLKIPHRFQHGGNKALICRLTAVKPQFILNPVDSLPHQQRTGDLIQRPVRQTAAFPKDIFRQTRKTEDGDMPQLLIGKPGPGAAFHLKGGVLRNDKQNGLPPRYRLPYPAQDLLRFAGAGLAQYHMQHQASSSPSG